MNNSTSKKDQIRLFYFTFSLLIFDSRISKIVKFRFKKSYYFLFGHKLISEIWFCS